MTPTAGPTAVPRTALDERLEQGVQRIRRADLVVGIPSFRSAATIGYVTGMVAGGLRHHFPDRSAVIVNADGGSRDGTIERVGESAGATPVIAGEYRGLPGKGSAIRAVFEVAGRLGASACAMVDADLRSITPEWVQRLLAPVVGGEADYVVPLYLRDKHDGTITNTIAYPLTRALYGARIRQPIGGEFGFSGDLARAFLDAGDWSGDTGRFGIDIFMTTTALRRKSRIVQAPLGAKVHDPKDAGSDLGPMFVQVLGTLFRLAADAQDLWRPVTHSRPIPVRGRAEPVTPDPLPMNREALIARFRDQAPAQRDVWRGILDDRCARVVAQALAGDAAVARLRGAAWARIVYDFLRAALRQPDQSADLARSLLPLYYARVASLGVEVAGADSAGAERAVEAQARAFEAQKPHALA